MPQIPKVNCKHWNKYGKCNKKPRVFFGLFKQNCIESLSVYDTRVRCDIAERIPRPEPPPRPQSSYAISRKNTFRSCPDCGRSMGRVVNNDKTTVHYCSNCGSRIITVPTI